MDASNLNLIPISNNLEKRFMFGEFWELDMNRGSHGGTKVCWARCDVTKMVIMGKFHICRLKMINSSAKSIKDFNNTSILLH
jgi:hypothetical protein